MQLPELQRPSPSNPFAELQRPSPSPRRSSTPVGGDPFRTKRSPRGGRRFGSWKVSRKSRARPRMHRYPEAGRCRSPPPSEYQDSEKPCDCVTIAIWTVALILATGLLVIAGYFIFRKDPGSAQAQSQPGSPQGTNAHQQQTQQGGFNQSPHQGGFNHGLNQGGFNQDQNQGGFNQDQNQGGFNQDQNQGGFNQDQNQGGFNQDQNQGGFNQGHTGQQFLSQELRPGDVVMWMKGNFVKRFRKVVRVKPDNIKDIVVKQIRGNLDVGSRDVMRCNIRFVHREDGFSSQDVYVDTTDNPPRRFVNIKSLFFANDRTNQHVMNLSARKSRVKVEEAWARIKLLDQNGQLGQDQEDVELTTLRWLPEWEDQQRIISHWDE